MNHCSKPVRAQNYFSETNTFAETTQEVIAEKKVKLVVNGDDWLSFICSPMHLEALAIGFLWNEHIINALEEVKNITINMVKGLINVDLKGCVTKPMTWHRTTTGLSISSKNDTQTITNNFTISAKELIRLFETFSSCQTLYKTVGGFHSAGLSDGERVNIFMEDVGRHNCMDKVAGQFLLDVKPFDPKIVLLTGRISSEMIHKALRLRVPLIVSRTTPTANAVNIARSNKCTLIGYLRTNHFTIYSHSERVTN